MISAIVIRTIYNAIFFPFLLNTEIRIRKAAKTHWKFPVIRVSADEIPMPMAFAGSSAKTESPPRTPPIPSHPYAPLFSPLFPAPANLRATLLTPRDFKRAIISAPFSKVV